MRVEWLIGILLKEFVRSVPAFIAVSVSLEVAFELTDVDLMGLTLQDVIRTPDAPVILARLDCAPVYLFPTHAGDILK